MEPEFVNYAQRTVWLAKAFPIARNASLVITLQVGLAIDAQLSVCSAIRLEPVTIVLKVIT